MPVTLSIYNMVGQLLFIEETNHIENIINTDKLPKGTYSVNIVNEFEKSFYKNIISIQ